MSSSSPWLHHKSNREWNKVKTTWYLNHCICCAVIVREIVLTMRAPSSGRAPSSQASAVLLVLKAAAMWRRVVEMWFASLSAIQVLCSASIEFHKRYETEIRTAIGCRMVMGREVHYHQTLHPSACSTCSCIIDSSAEAKDKPQQNDTKPFLKRVFHSFFQELYALAWTLLRFRGPCGRPRPVLVVAGGSGKLHLLYPTENCCYGIIDAHNQPVSTMCFHPSKESLLFTASYDKTVALWDIGTPDTDLNFSHQKLMTLAVAGVPLKLTPVMACPERGLLAAGVGGCWAWDISLDNSKKYRRHHVKFSFPLIKNTKNGDWRTVDALVFVSDDVIASRSVGQGSLYLWSWARSVQVDGWPARIARPCRAVILAVLPWMITQELYTGLAADPGD
uniref:Leucine-rich repeat and WD repeat-containing protein 1 WD domain-containing protein n=1 Tax=Eptatretus burgeri TaxID=7764 RepID=A0A8C4Q0X0_EPTBU